MWCGVVRQRWGRSTERWYRAQRPGLFRFCLVKHMRVLRTIRVRFGSRAWSRYGFINAFNPMTQLV